MKKGFTLVELLAVIVIIGILGIITVPNVLEYFNESKREAMIIQENKLVEAGDVLVRDYCKTPLNDKYLLECDEHYQQLDNVSDETIVHGEENTYTRYVCVKDLKELNYYTEELKYSKTPCHGVVVYLIDEDTDMQKESFAVVKCGNAYKTVFDDEAKDGYEEFLEKQDTRADQLEKIFKDCFQTEGEQPPQQEENKEYMLTIKFTEHNPYGQEVAETINEKVI